ncbi:MAG: ABC transporter substrate-binding protein [Actinobacteria bacterium]|nr:ABC transporter substrate-binding protein [Actinomycetota bacterium]
MLLLAASLAVAGCGSSSSSSGSQSGGGSAEGGELTFGVLTALSGSAAAYGEAEKVSAEIAAEEINAKGGIKAGGNTYKVKLAFYDQAYDPTKAATAATKAVQQDGLQFVSNLGGGTVQAVQPITERAGSLLFCMCAGVSFVGKAHPLTFRPYFGDPESLAASLAYLKTVEPGVKRIVNLLPDESIGHETAPEFEEVVSEAGLENETVFIPRGESDYSATLTKVLQGNPDVINFGPNDSGTYQTVVKQAFQLGYKGRYIFPDTLEFDPTLKAVPQGALERSIASPCNLSARTPAAKAWAAGYEKKTGGEEPQWWSAQLHDNWMLVAAAMEKAGSIEPEAVAKALGEVSIQGATAGGGEVHYGPAEAGGPPQIFKVPYPVCEVVNGKQKQVTKG